jgi:hypothetical protein
VLPGTAAVVPTELALPAEPPLPESEDAGVTAATAAEQIEEAAIPRRFRYEIKVEARTVYDDNVNLSRQTKRDDTYVQIAPEFYFGIGDINEQYENYISTRYSPSAYFFLNNSDLNTTEHIASLTGQWRIARLAIRLSQDIESIQSANLDVPTTTGGISNQLNLDVGGRRRLSTYATRLDLIYAFTGKMSLRAEADFIVRDYERLTDSTTVAGALGFDYVYGPKLRLGLGVRAGEDYLDEPSPDQSFQQVNVRANYDASEKLRITSSAGVEFRSSEGFGRTRTSPLFTVGATYAPFDGTQLGFAATQRTYNSAVEGGRDFLSTQFVLRARQRLLQRFFLSVAAGLQSQDYDFATDDISADREDNYRFIAPAFDVIVTRYGTVGVYYAHRENDSSNPLFGFEDNQFGLRSTLTF